MKLHYKAPQRQLSQGFNIFIDSYCVICKNYVRLCGNLRIMRPGAIFDQLCGIAPLHFIRGPGYYLLVSLNGEFVRYITTILIKIFCI